MNHIYQLKIELKGSSPLIWRRIQVLGEVTFSELHDIIQISMGWEDAHMYKFKYKNISVYDFEEDFDHGTNPTERDSLDTFLNEIVSKVKSKFSYVYDFGDHWEHVILLEKILPEKKGQTYPNCIDGASACPPEDCGGILGYQNKLNILTDKNHPAYEDTIEWMGENWDTELFNCEITNFSLQTYMEPLYDFDEGIDETFPYRGLDDTYENEEYENLKKFTCPADVLNDKTERPRLEIWLKNELGETISVEYQAFERLGNLGIDEKKSNVLILEALSIEWFYDLKYGTDHLEDRYTYNLQHLPEKPKEFPRSKDALAVLDACMKGIPYTAIEYLQNDTSEETTSAILKALRNHSDHQYCWANCSFAPFWYALAAEGHLCEELIDPVIQFYENNLNDSDWIYDQGQFLIGKLAQKYPDLTASKVLEAMELEVEKKSKDYIFHLFDAFHFCDINRYKARLLEFLKQNNLHWYDPLASTVADLSIVEGLPILKERIELLKTNPDKDPWNMSSIVEIEESIQILEGTLIIEPDTIKPLCLTREGSWKDVLEKEDQEIFYEKEGFSDPFLFEDDTDPNSENSASLPWPSFPNATPIIKEKAPGRNDPCPCGSGKKYKKCCMGKDE